MTVSDTTTLPDYSEDKVGIRAEFQAHENKTVTITFHAVPLLDVPDLFEQLVTPEGEAALIEGIAGAVENLIAKRLSEILGFEVR